MVILSNSDYEAKKQAFLKEAENWRVETCPMDEHETYVKTYICDNRNVLTEIKRVVYETVDVEVKGVKCKVEVKLFELEMFSNRWQSVYSYQKY